MGSVAQFVCLKKKKQTGKLWVTFEEVWLGRRLGKACSASARRLEITCILKGSIPRSQTFGARSTTTRKRVLQESALSSRSWVGQCNNKHPPAGYVQQDTCNYRSTFCFCARGKPHLARGWKSTPVQASSLVVFPKKINQTFSVLFTL